MSSRLPSPGATQHLLTLAPFRRPRLLIFTIAAVLAYGAVEALVIHRVARFQELGFALGTVALWAGISGLLTLPGRFVLPIVPVGPGRILRDVSTEPHSADYEVVASFTVEAGKTSTVSVP